MEDLISEIIRITGISQSQIARDTGIDRKYIGKVINGKIKLTLETENLLRYIYKDVLEPNTQQPDPSIDSNRYESIKNAQIEKNKSNYNYILDIIEKFGITQSQIAKDTGLSREYINKLAKGALEISGKTIDLLKTTYGEIKTPTNSTLNFEKSDNKTPYQNNVDKITLNETSVHSIIETNRNISRTLEKMVDTNMKFAKLLENILPPKTETYQGVHQDVLTKMSQMLEYLVEVGAGKRWETKEAGIEELNKRFYGNAEVSQEKDTQTVTHK